MNGECIKNQGSSRCQCARGFTLGPDRRTCLGYYISECETQPGVCVNGECINKKTRAASDVRLAEDLPSDQIE